MLQNCFHLMFVSTCFVSLFAFATWSYCLIYMFCVVVFFATWSLLPYLHVYVEVSLLPHGPNCLIHMFCVEVSFCHMVLLPHLHILYRGFPFATWSYCLIYMFCVVVSFATWSYCLIYMFCVEVILLPHGPIASFTCFV